MPKIQSQPIRIEFTSLNRGGGFSGELNAQGELLIQLKQSYLKHPDIKSRLVHEWFHALHFLSHPNEASWIREGLATLFVYLTSDGVTFPKYPGSGLLDALSKSTTPLQYAFDPNQMNSEAYGHVFFYFLYLYRNCGGDDLFWKMVQGTSGVLNEGTLDFALKNTDSEYCGNFKTSATQAEVARFHNRVVYKSKTADKKYFVISDYPVAKFPPIKPSTNLKAQVASLGKFQPLWIAKQDLQKLGVVRASIPLEVFSLDQDFPYSVKRGLPEAGSTKNYRVLILKSQ